MTFAIYRIENVKDGKVYIGSTNNPQKRWLDHRSGLRRGDHGNYRLQAAWSAGEEADFEFTVLTEVGTEDERYDTEQAWIDTYKSAREEFGYNVAPNSRSSAGVKRREDARLKMSLSHTGKSLTESHKQSISDSMRLVQKSDEHQRKITESIRNRPLEIYARGENVGGSKLKECQVLEILKLKDQGESDTNLAKMFGVSNTSIIGIKSGRTWKHVFEKYKKESEAV